MKTNSRALTHAFVANPDLVGKSNGAMSCRGRVFYSYRMPIARIDDVTRTAYVDRRKVSVTTSKHQTYIVGALAAEGFHIIERDLGRELP